MTAVDDDIAVFEFIPAGERSLWMVEDGVEDDGDAIIDGAGGRIGGDEDGEPGEDGGMSGSRNGYVEDVTGAWGGLNSRGGPSPVALGDEDDGAAMGTIEPEGGSVYSER